jgi:hypothetical protein
LQSARELPVCKWRKSWRSPLDALSYRIESTCPIVATLPRTDVPSGSLLSNRELAISIATKSQIVPRRGGARGARAQR